MARLHPQQEEQTARRQCRRGEETTSIDAAMAEPQAEPELQAAHGCRAVEQVSCQRGGDAGAASVHARCRPGESRGGRGRQQ